MQYLATQLSKPWVEQGIIWVFMGLQNFFKTMIVDSSINKINAYDTSCTAYELNQSGGTISVAFNNRTAVSMTVTVRWNGTGATSYRHNWSIHGYASF